MTEIDVPTTTSYQMARNKQESTHETMATDESKFLLFISCKFGEFLEQEVHTRWL